MGQLWSHFEPEVLSALGGLDLQARYIVEGFLVGLHTSPFHGFSVEFSEYRDYQPGDDLRHLDWRLYARSDRLCIKKYIQETNVRFYIVCDSSGSMGYRGSSAWGSKLDVARVVAAAIAWLMLGQNDAAGLLTCSGEEAAIEFIRPSQKPSQLGLILQHLERLRPAPEARFAALIDQAVRRFHRRSVILLFTDLLEPASRLAEGLKELRFLGHECLVFQVLDRDEIEFPFADNAVFEDLETAQRRRIAPRAVRDSYLERFRTHMDAHERQFSSLEIPQLRMTTSDSPWTALTEFLTQRKRLL